MTEEAFLIVCSKDNVLSKSVTSDTICNVEYMPIIDAEKDDLVWEDMTTGVEEERYYTVSTYTTTLSHTPYCQPHSEDSGQQSRVERLKDRHKTVHRGWGANKQ